LFSTTCSIAFAAPTHLLQLTKHGLKKIQYQHTSACLTRRGGLLPTAITASRRPTMSSPASGAIVISNS
jgi:hypothetical protein